MILNIKLSLVLLFGIKKSVKLFVLRIYWLTKKIRASNGALYFFAILLDCEPKRLDRLASDGEPLTNFVCLPLIKGQKPVGVTKQSKDESIEIIGDAFGFIVF